MFRFLLPGTTSLFHLVVFAQKAKLHGSLWALVTIYSAQSMPSLVASGLLISIVPCVLVYAFLQRYVVQGLTAGALKGI